MNLEQKSRSSSAPYLSPLEVDTVDLFVQIASLFGLTRSVGEIYGLLFITSQPVPFEHIREKLQLSGGSASQGLRMLRGVGAVRVTYIPGDRRDHYIAETDLPAIARGFFRDRVEPRFMDHEARIHRLSCILDEASSHEKGHLEERLRILEEWRRQARTVLPLLLKGLEARE